MKKLLRLGLCLGVLAAALTCTALAAPGVNTEGSTTANEDCTVIENPDGSYTAAYTAVTKDEQYALLVVRQGADGRYSVSQESIMYIDQQAATETGVSFTFIPKSTPDCVVLLGGDFGESGPSSPVTLGTLKGKGVSVSGSVTSVNRKAATVKLYDESKQLLQTVETNAEGGYSFGSVPEGTYDIEASKAGHLSNYISVSVVGADVAAPVIQLYGGDVDGSNAVDAPDLTAVIMDYNKTSGFTNENSDLDGDGAVNAVDLTQIITNYNRTGKRVQ